MVISKDRIKIEAPPEVLTFITQNGLEGKETQEIFQIKDLPFNIASWFVYNYGVTDIEKQQYNEYFNIRNCKNIYYSRDLEYSSFISLSSEVQNSKNIIHCEKVENSSDVYNSSIVRNSSLIFDSNYIDECSKLFKVKNSANSTNIVYSTYVINSEDIVDSIEIIDSKGIRNCNKVKNSFFCSSSTNLEGCFFCADIKDKSYHIFNKPYDKEQCPFLLKQFNTIYTPLSLVKSWPSEIISDVDIIRFWDYHLYFQTQSKDFWDWVQTLPNFNSDILYEITYMIYKF